MARRPNVKHRQAGTRLGSYYRWVLTAAVWPTATSATRILDVGCHDGFWLQRQTGFNAKVGCDLEPVALYGDIQYVRCDAGKLPFATGSFDLCTAWDVVEHVQDDQAMLSELCRVLRPGGLARLSVPHKQITVFPAFLMPWVNRRWQHSIRSGYAPSEIESLAKAADFAECRVMALKIPWFRALYLLGALLWRILRPAGRCLVGALARGDAAAGQGPNGCLFVEMRKT